MEKESVEMDRKQSVEQELRAYLRNGEQVCWQGKTESFPLLENDAKWLILGKWIGTVVVAFAILMLYIGNNPEWSVKVVGLVLLVGTLLVISPILERNSVLRQQYWITNQRVILMAKDHSFYYMELSEIDAFQMVKGKTAHDCLVIGSCLFEEINRQLRWRACHPKTDVQSDGHADQAMGLVLFNLSNAEGAAAHLRQRKSGTAA